MRQMMAVAVLAGMLLVGSAGADGWDDLAPAPPTVLAVTDPNQVVRHEALLQHGVNPDPASLLLFLEEGISFERVRAGLPELPEYKVELVNFAIQELGLAQAPAAVPALRAICEGRLSPGIQRMAALDFEKIPVELLDSTRSVMRGLFTMNAMVALGMIGDPSAAPAIQQAIAREQGSRFTTEGAIALAMLGDRSGLGPLLMLAREAEEQDSLGAFAAFYYISGRNYGLSPQSSVAKRKERYQQLQQWFEAESAQVFLDRQAILRRRLAGPPTPVAPAPGSLQELLRATRNPLDQGARIAARTRILDRGRTVSGDLRLIALDAMEDSDIRTEAIRWWGTVEGKRARKDLRRLRKDPNAEVADIAERILQRIEAQD